MNQPSRMRFLFRAIYLTVKKCRRENSWTTSEGISSVLGSTWTRRRRSWFWRKAWDCLATTIV